MRTDLAPRIFAPSSHFFPTSTPAFLSAVSEEARFVGALFEMWWTLVPVATVFATSLSSHFFPDALDGSKMPSTNMLSSVTSPNSPDRMSMRVTPGNVSFVNCGKSSIVISPYFSFICADVIWFRPAGWPVPAPALASTAGRLPCSSGGVAPALCRRPRGS